MKSRVLLLVAALVVLLPALAGAQERRSVQPMTVEDVIELSQSKVGDHVIMNQIQASGTVFKLTVDDILDLKNAGVSDDVITFMINTGKNDGGAGDNQGSDDGEYVDRYHSGVDSYYRGYDDPSWNVYLSWGFGGYYDPWYWWWPSYSYYYYYPATCLRPYWPYYPYYHHYVYSDYSHYGYRDRSYKDGRHISGRGGSRQAPVWGRESGRQGDRSGTRSGSGREYKGSGSSRSSSPPARESGRTMKSPTYGGRGGQAPPPSSSGTKSAPPPSSQQSGRTMKKS